jgi:hypothetical protein
MPRMSETLTKGRNKAWQPILNGQPNSGTQYVQLMVVITVLIVLTKRPERVNSRYSIFLQILGGMDVAA